MRTALRKFSFYSLGGLLVVSSGIAIFAIRQNMILKKELDRQVLRYENTLSEKLELEKKHNRLMIPYLCKHSDSANKQGGFTGFQKKHPSNKEKSDSLEKLLRQKDLEIYKMKRIINQLNSQIKK